MIRLDYLVHNGRLNQKSLIVLQLVSENQKYSKFQGPSVKEAGLLGEMNTNDVAEFVTRLTISGNNSCLCYQITENVL